MKTTYSIGLATLAAAVLAACGGNDVPPGPTIDLGTARGSIVANSPAILAAFPGAADYKAALSASASGRSLLAVAGDPKCGVT